MTQDEMQARIVELERKNAELETRLQILGDMAKKIPELYEQEWARRRRASSAYESRSFWDFIGL